MYNIYIILVIMNYPFWEQNTRVTKSGNRKSSSFNKWKLLILVTHINHMLVLPELVTLPRTFITEPGSSRQCSLLI